MDPIRHNSDIRSRLGLRQIVNVSGTMTALGASINGPEAIQAMAEMAPEWVEIDDLQRKASAPRRCFSSSPITPRSTASCPWNRSARSATKRACR